MLASLFGGGEAKPQPFKIGDDVVLKIEFNGYALGSQGSIVSHDPMDAQLCWEVELCDALLVDDQRHAEPLNDAPPRVWVRDTEIEHTKPAELIDIVVKTLIQKDPDTLSGWAEGQTVNKWTVSVRAMDHANGVATVQTIMALVEEEKGVPMVLQEMVTDHIPVKHTYLAHGMKK